MYKPYVSAKHYTCEKKKLLTPVREYSLTVQVDHLFAVMGSLAGSQKLSNTGILGERRTIGPSGVRALPVAAGRNEDGYYFRYIIPLVVVGGTVIQNTRKGWGAIFSFFQVFLENIRRRSVRILKLHRGFILTKKDINTNKNQRLSLAPQVGGYYNGVKYDLDQTVPGGCSLS